MSVSPYDERYRTVMGSDGARVGMVLELWDRTSDTLALWAFYSDANGSIEFEYYADVPPQVEVWFQEEARRRLPPIDV